MADKGTPHFHNEPGVAVIHVGSKEFMCIGAKPPLDHPHIFLDMGDDDGDHLLLLLDPVQIRPVPEAGRGPPRRMRVGGGLRDRPVLALTRWADLPRRRRRGRNRRPDGRAGARPAGPRRHPDRAPHRASARSAPGSSSRPTPAASSSISASARPAPGRDGAGPGRRSARSRSGARDRRGGARAASCASASARPTGSCTGPTCRRILLDAVRSPAAIRIVDGAHRRGRRSRRRTAPCLTCRRQRAAARRLSFDAVIGADGLWSKVRACPRRVERRRPIAALSPGAATVRPTRRRPKLRGQRDRALARAATAMWCITRSPAAASSTSSRSSAGASRSRAGPTPGDGDRAPRPLRARRARPAGRSSRRPNEWLLWSLFDRPAGRLAAGRDRAPRRRRPPGPALPRARRGARHRGRGRARPRSCSPRRPRQALKRYPRPQRLGARRRSSPGPPQRHDLSPRRPAGLRPQPVMRQLGPEGMTRRYDWLYGYAGRTGRRLRRPARPLTVLRPRTWRNW